MVQISWTKIAIEDLRNIKNYINNDTYSKITIKKILKHIKLLKNFMEIGRIVPEFNDENIRELIEGNYRIVYRIHDLNKIDIISIFHSSRDMSKLKIIKS